MNAIKAFTLHTSAQVEVVSGTILYDDVAVDDELTEVEFLGPPPVQQRATIRLVPAPLASKAPTLRERLRRLAPEGMVLMPRRRRPLAAR